VPFAPAICNGTFSNARARQKGKPLRSANVDFFLGSTEVPVFFGGACFPSPLHHQSQAGLFSTGPSANRQPKTRLDINPSGRLGK